MLDFYSALGRLLHPIRPLLWVFAVLAVLVFLGVVFWAEPSEDQTYELASIILLLWALSLVVVAQTFADSAQKMDPTAGLFGRVRSRISRGIRWFMALVTTGLFCLVILLSFRAAGLLLRG